MTRRIVAALLALMLLFTSFPVFAGAEETAIYTKGQTICISKKMENYDPNHAKSTYPVQTGYLWQIKRDEKGQRVDACTQEEHAHVKACFQSGSYICGKDAHTHDQLGECDPYMGWVWEVVRDPNYDGWDYDPDAPENYAFSVICIDPDGVHPMVGVGFQMFRTATEEEKAATGNDKISVLENSQSLLTNKKGFAYFDGTCKTTEAAGDYTWTLVQNTTKFAPGGEYHDTYRPHTVQWQVDVTVHGDGTYTVKDIREPDDQAAEAAAEENLPEQGYSKALRRLVMLHDPVRVKLYIDGRFVPQGMEQFEVTITGASGTQDTITMTNGDQGWHYVYEAVPDTYSISASVTGYPIAYRMGYPNEELTEGEGLELNADHSNGLFEIHFGTLSNTVKLLSQDPEGRSVADAAIRYGIFRDTYENGEKPIVEFVPDEAGQVLISSSDWMDLAVNNQDLATDEDLTNLMNGGSIDVTLKQSQSSVFYTDAQEEYTLTLRQAPETSEELFSVTLAAAKGEQKVRFGEEGEQIATFLHEKADLSHRILIEAYDDAETPNRIPGGSFALYEDGEKLDLEIVDEIDFSTFEVSGKREFILKQETAAAGYLKDEEQEYKITLDWEEDKPTVTVAKNENLLRKVVAFFTGERIGQDEFGRWTVVFVNKKAAPSVKISNTVEIHSVDEEAAAISNAGIRYGLFRDTYENGEVPVVEFPNDTITENGGVIRITSDDWMEIALSNQTLASAADIAALMDGGSIDITLKQSGSSQFYEDAQEEYILTLSKADDGSEDQFKVRLSVAKGGEQVRYGANGEQQVTFVHESKPIQITNTVEIYSVDENRNAITDEAVRYGLFRDTYENGEKPAVEFPTEAITQNNGVIRITSDDWMNIAMANQNLASAADLMALRNGESIDITLKQSNAPAAYGDAVEEYTLTLSRAAAGSEDLFSVVLSAAKGSEPVRYSVTGAQQVYFVHEKIDMSHIVTIKTYDDAAGTNDLSDKGAVYALYENGALFQTLDSNEIDFSTFEAVDKEFVLKQESAPQGYKQAAEQYSIALTWTEGEPTVVVEENRNLLQQIAQLFSGNGVEQDANGRWIAAFVSEKIVDTTAATAKVQLTLEDVQKIWNSGVTKDSAMESEINEMGYAFVLSWKENEDLGWQKYSKQLVLSSGTKSKTGVFDMEIPVGASYKIEPADPDRLYSITFKAGTKTGTDVIEGTVTKENTTANNGIISVTAAPRFEFAKGDVAASLTLYKVNARDLTKPLSGAKFTLKDEAGMVLRDYSTQKDGAITIYTNSLNDSVSYTLKETIAPEGYVLLKKAIDINLEYQYETETTNGKLVAKQNLTLSPTLSSDVVQGSDGTYYIKNVYESDMPQTGDTFNPVLWTGMLAASAAALAFLLTGRKRSRSAR